jgi:hypothetical protein
VRTIDGLSSATSRRSASWLSSRPQNDEAGDHITGCRLPLAILVSTSPDAITVGSTAITLPPLSCRSALKRFTSGASSFSFSGE